MVLLSRWADERRDWLGRLVRSLGEDRELFDRFFEPGLREGGDFVDHEFRAALDDGRKATPPRSGRRARASRRTRVKP